MTNLDRPHTIQDLEILIDWWSSHQPPMTNRHSQPEDLFRAEKERALTVRNSQHARLLAEAKAAFDKLMAEGQAARKSGRPRKHPLPPLKTSSARPPLK